MASEGVPGLPHDSTIRGLNLGQSVKLRRPL